MTTPSTTPPMGQEQCRHQREALRGEPVTGACVTCVPEMFPSKEQRRATERWFRDYRASRAMQSKADQIEEITEHEWAIIREHLQGVQV